MDKKDHAFLAVGCLIVFLTIIWLINGAPLW